MYWIKNNFFKVLLSLINIVLLVLLILNSYEVVDGGYSFIWDILKIFIPILLATLSLVGLFEEKKLWYIAGVILGVALLISVFSLNPGQVAKEIAAINNKLGTAEDLTYLDFKILIKFLAAFLSLVSLMTLYIYPFNILLVDLAFIFFLWAVDYLGNAKATLIPFIFLWAFIIAHGRGVNSDLKYYNYNEKKLHHGRRLLQVILIGLLTGIITIKALGFNKGIYYDKLWMKANDFLMQDEFLSGNKFLNAFSLKSSGYNDSSTTLGGDINLNDNLVLTINGDKPKYLRGNTKYRYTGKIWEKNNFIYRTENSANTEVIESYKGSSLKKMIITPKNIRTSSIFVPSYPSAVMVSEVRKNLKLYYSIKDQTFVLDEVTVKPYEVSFYEEEEVKNKAISSQNENYISDTGIFLEIPNTVTKRTRDLVSQIIKGKNTKEERLEAIKEYLSKNYKYTLNPGNYPPDVDFVDYFLFESKEGYCVHYATAMTIMSRLANIPARYAEGYKVPEAGEGDLLEVSNKDGHAWSEALIDGGNEVWVIYDATGSARDHENGTSTENGKKEDETTSEEPKENTKPEENNTETPKESPKDNPQDAPQEKNENTLEDDNNNNNNLNFLKFLVIIPFLLLILLILYLIKKYRMKKIMLDKNNEFIKYIMALLEKVEGPMGSSETLKDYVLRIENAEYRDNFAYLISDTYANMYGDYPKSAEDNFRRDFLLDTYDLYEEKNGRLKTFIKRYFL